MMTKQILQYALMYGVFVLTGCPLAEQPGTDFSMPSIDFAPRHYLCYRTSAPLQVDGLFQEADWSQVNWSQSFVDIQGPGKPPPTWSTKMKMLWDNDYLYIAAEMEEPHVWAKLGQRDTVIFYDNDFEIFIDPDGDTHQYYEFEMNARNTVWDLLLIKPYRDDGPAVNGWNIQGLKTAVSVQGTLNDPRDEDQGWRVELAFPWSALQECSHRKTPPAAGDQWRINFSRVEWKTAVKEGNYQKTIDPATGRSLPEDNWVWSPQGLINMHYPEMWGYVQFSSQRAGKAEQSFIEKPEECVKWALRNVYYRERQFFLRHKRYTDNWQELQSSVSAPAGYTWPPQIMITPFSFEALSTSVDGRSIWRISADGRIGQETRE
jgi:hypothetical protein